jgi:uncharacterized pyridoxamine 5'-phosphate oxidase family protein
MKTIAASPGNKTQHLFSDYTIQDRLGSNVIALDAEKKQLLFLTNKSQTMYCRVIDLNSLNSCSITKEYSSIKPGDLKRNKLSRFLKNIFLNLGSGNEPVTLPVYNAQQDSNANVRFLESMAKKWQKIVSKFLKDKAQK